LLQKEHSLQISIKLESHILQVAWNTLVFGPLSNLWEAPLRV